MGVKGEEKGEEKTNWEREERGTEMSPQLKFLATPLHIAHCIITAIIRQQTN